MSQETAVAPAKESTPLQRPAWETFEMVRLPILRPEINLYNFQQYAINKAIRQRIFCIALSTGLGKTVCSYASYFYYRMVMKAKGIDTRLLIVTNKSAVLQFRSELDKFFDHGLKAVAVHSGMAKLGAKNYAGARRNAYEMWSNTYDPNSQLDVLVMNYATFRMDVGDMKFEDRSKPLEPGEVYKIKASKVGTIGRAIQQLQENGVHVFVVFDEATVFKNIQTATHRAVEKVASASHRVTGLTATLTKGKLEEIYAIYKALGVQLARNKEEFENEYCVVFQHPKQRFVRSIRGYKNTAKFVQLIRDISIVLRKIDVAKFLPAYSLRKIPVEHSPEQFKIISDVYSGLIDITQFGQDLELEADDQGVFSLPGETTEAVDAENPFNLPATPDQLPDENANQKRVTTFMESGFIKRALLDHRIVTKQGLNDFKTMSPKTKEIIRLLNDEFTGEKIVIYTPSKLYLKLLRKTIENHPDVPDYYKKVLEISGDISQVDREQAKIDFTDSKQHNIIIINDAGLESINLQAASVLIVATMPSSGGNMVQLAGRLSRIGSTHANLLLLYLLTENSQDEDEYIIINQQMQMMAQVMGEAEKGLLDWDALREAEAERRKMQEELSEDEFKKASMQQLLFHKRNRRASFYTANATALMAESLDSDAEESEDDYV